MNGGAALRQAQGRPGRDRRGHPERSRGAAAAPHLRESVAVVVPAVLIVASFLSLALLPLASAQGRYMGSLPRPGGWVNDFAGVFDESSRQKLFELCVELEKKTTAELAVVTVTSLYGESVESYATRLFNYWGVGKRGANNGVMLLFSMQDRRMRIAVGDGLTAVLPDSLCQQIIDDTIVPLFRAGRHGDGAYAGAARIAEALSVHYGQRLETLRIYRPPRMSPLTAIGHAISRFVQWLGWVILLPIYIVLRLLFGRTVWWESLESSVGDSGWTSGWGGGGGGFGGGSTGGGGASGSW